MTASNRFLRPSPVAKASNLSGYSSTGFRWVFLASLLGCMISCIYFAPAAWLARFVAHISRERVWINNAEGSIWNGSGQLVLTGGAESRDATALPQRVYWKIEPKWNLTLNAELGMPCCTLSSTPLSLKVSPNFTGADVILAPASMTLPAGLLVGLGAPFNTLDLQATLTFHTTGLTIQSKNRQITWVGSSTLILDNVSTPLSSVKPLGSYRINLQHNPQQTTPTMNVETLSGSKLRVTGVAGATPNGRTWQFRGEASANPEAMENPESLNNLLTLLGRRVGNKTLLVLN